MLGKYHLGFATSAHMPKARGFTTFLGYLAGTEDYYYKSHISLDCGNVTDFWQTNASYDGPARDARFYPPDSGELCEGSYSAFGTEPSHPAVVCSWLSDADRCCYEQSTPRRARS